MMRVERHPSRKQLTVFGLSWLVFWGSWGTVSWWNAGLSRTAVVFWLLAFVMPMAGFIRLEILRIAFLIAAYITLPIGLVVSSVVLMVLYYLILTPIGVVLRMTGYDPMRRNFSSDAGTYWVHRDPVSDSERYFKQF
jgi:hypothetical protein